MSGGALEINGDTDENYTNPYGAFVETTDTGYGKILRDGSQNLPSSIRNGQYHNIEVRYVAATQRLEISLSTPEGVKNFWKYMPVGTENPMYYFTIASSTGVWQTSQSIRFDSMTYAGLQESQISYYDKDTNELLSEDEVFGKFGDEIVFPEDPKAKIEKYEENGYYVVSNDFVQGVTFNQDDRVDQKYKVFLSRKVPKPTIEDAKDTDKTITGTGTPGTKVVVTDKDRKTIGESIVDEDGKWSMPVPEERPLVGGEDLKVTETNPEGKAGESTGQVTEVPTLTPEINEVKTEDDKITGTGTPGNKIEVTFPDGTKKETTVDEAGNWTVDVPEGTELKPGDKISVVETKTVSESGKTPEPKSKKKDGELPNTGSKL